MICFLGEPTVGRAKLPRIGVWRSSGVPDEISLDPGPRRLLARLAIPPLRFGVGLRDAGIADALARQLSEPLTPWSPAQLRQALDLRRTTEYRHRRNLGFALEALHLSEHLETARGEARLVKVATDVAWLTQAVRAEDWEAAERLLTYVGRGDPERVQWVLPDLWPERCHAAVRETLGLAKGRLSTHSSHGGPGVALVPAAGSLPWRERPVDPRPARRRRLRRALAAATLGAVAAAAAAVAFLPPSETPNDVLALSWPQPDSPYQEPQHTVVANLSKQLGLDEGVPATRGDELLVRARIAAERTRQRPLAVEGHLAASDGEQTRASLELLGSRSGIGAEVEARTGSPELRLRWLPGTTVLRSADGALVRRLADVRNGRRVPLPALRPGQTYFVDTRLTVDRVTADDPGQVAQREVFCFDPLEDPGQASGHVRLGRTMKCEVELLNLGPRTLETVYLQFHTGGEDRTLASTWVIADSTLASPRRTYMADAKRILGDAPPRPTILFVAGSLRAVPADGEPYRPEGGFFEGVEIGELAPGPDNALKLRFRVLVD